MSEKPSPAGGAFGAAALPGALLFAVMFAVTSQDDAILVGLLDMAQ